MKIFFYCMLLMSIFYWNPARSQNNEQMREYKIYNWMWGDGLDNSDPLRQCVTLPNFSLFKTTFFNAFQSEMGNSNRIKAQTDDDHPFVKLYDHLTAPPEEINKHQPIANPEHIAIIGTTYCDSAYLTLRIFVYDFRQRNLWQEYEYYLLPTSNSRAILQKAAKKIALFCKTGHFPDGAKNEPDVVEIPSVVRLEEAIFSQRYLEMYNYYLQYSGGSQPNPVRLLDPNPSLFNRSNQEANHILKLINYYKSSKGNYKDLKVRYLQLTSTDPKDNSKKRIMENVKKWYPRVWALLDLIVALEDFKEKPDDKNPENDNRLTTTRNRLMNIDSALPTLSRRRLDKETELFKQRTHAFLFDSIRQEMLIASQLVLNCKAIFNTAEAYFKQNDMARAASIYMSIMRNQEIDMFESLALQNGNMSCGKLKTTSYERLENINLRKVQLYQEKLAKADDAFWRVGINRNAMTEVDLLYQSADSFNLGLSLYPRLRRVAFLQRLGDSIERVAPQKKAELTAIYENMNQIQPNPTYEKKINKLNELPRRSGDETPPIYDEYTWLRKLNEMGDVIAKHLNGTSPKLSTIGQTYTQKISNGNDSKSIRLSLTADSDALKSWVQEINFNLGYFESPNELFIDKSLAAGLGEITQRFEKDLARINISLTGSADATPFKGKLVLAKQYKNLDALVTVCNAPSIKQSFQKLLKGIWTDDNLVSRGSSSPKSSKFYTKDSDKAKNHALAYLRALNRADHLRQQLQVSCSHRMLEHLNFNLCAQVANTEGKEFRFVNIEILIELK